MNYLKYVKDPNEIRVIMINEVVPELATDDFYYSNHSAYIKSVKALFSEAGLVIEDANDLLARGIYLTNVLKTPKSAMVVKSGEIDTHLEALIEELEAFPHLEVIMLMGDVAKKAFNKIVKMKKEKSVIPSVSTYKLHNQAFYFHHQRIIPSYIMTGENIMIEKSKFKMVSEDIQTMLSIIQK